MNILTTKINKNLVNIILDYNMINRLKTLKYHNKLTDKINKKYKWNIQYEENQNTFVIEKTRLSLNEMSSNLNNFETKLNTIKDELDIVDIKVNNVGNKIDILSDKINEHDQKCKQVLNDLESSIIKTDF